MKRILVCLVLAGCSGSFSPIIDESFAPPRGHTIAQDLADCKSYAAKVSLTDNLAGAALDGAASGASIGAVVGGIGSAALGGIGALPGAGLGAAAGFGVELPKGIREHLAEQAMVERNCLKGRGWAVLN